LSGWNFESFRAGFLTGFVDSGLQRFLHLDIRQDACSCAFFPEEKMLALGLGGHAWSWAAEFRWQFRLLVYAGRIKLGLRQA